MPKRQPPMKLWHYTTGEKLPMIQSDGVILQSPNTNGAERPAVWFSSNPVWEITARKGEFDPLTGFVHDLEMEEHVEFCDGLIRIGVAPTTAPHDWNAFRRLSGIQPKHANILRDVAFRWGARPGQWYVTFDPVPRSKWLSIETWLDGRWTDHPTFDTLPAVAA